MTVSKKWSVKKLIMASVLGISLLMSGQVDAACISTQQPFAYTGSAYFANGDKRIVFDPVDYDAIGTKLWVVRKNGVQQAPVRGRPFDGIMPKGAGTWDFYAADLNTCGQPVRYLWSWRVTN